MLLDITGNIDLKSGSTVTG